MRPDLQVYCWNIINMDELIKIKGLKGKQNKKKWAKNIDVSGLLDAKAREHDEQLRLQFQ